MAIIRMAARAAAALVALAAIVPATSQAQAPRAPLQLMPGPDQAGPTRSANSKAKPVSKSGAKTSDNKTSNKVAPAAAARKNTRQVAARPSPKPKAGAKRPAAHALANRRQAPPTVSAGNAHRTRLAKSVTRPAAAAPPILDRAEGMPPIVALGAGSDGDDHVMRDGDSISLVGRLPWWRNDRMQTVTYGSPEAESKVLEAAAVWLAANGMADADHPVGGTVAAAALERPVEVADPSEVNDIDLAAGPVSAPPTPTFLQSLLALIGGAASAVAATVRQLFA